MTLRERIKRWKEYPNALGSEAEAAVLVAEVARTVNEEVPSHVTKALKQLALRGIMRDLAQAIQRGEGRRPEGLGLHDVVEVGAAAAGLSWTEALAVIADYFGARWPRIEQQCHE